MLQIEVIERDASGYLSPRAARLDDFGKRAPEIADGILSVADLLRAELDAKAAESTTTTSAWRMDSLTLSFELALEAEAGIVIARAKTSATFAVEISWSREPLHPTTT